MLDGASLVELAQGAGPSWVRGRPARIGGPEARAPRKSGTSPASAPLSLEQEALWAAERLAPGAYTIAVAAVVQNAEDLDADALVVAVETAIARHPALGARFSDSETGPIQTFAQPRLETIREDGEPVDFSQRIEEFVARPFDLGAGPLVRLAVLEGGEGNQTAIGFAVHHLVADFTSLALLAGEVAVIYAAEVSARLPRLAPPSAISLGDLIAWRTERLAALDRGPESAFAGRLAALSAVEDLDLPTDRPRPPRQTYRGFLRSLPPTAAVALGLERLARSSGTTPFALLTGAFSAFLHRTTGQSQFALVAPTAGRTAPGLETLVGYLVQPAAIPVDLEGNPSFATHLERTRRASALAVASAESAPFALLVERLRPRRDPARPPLAQVAVAFERAGRVEDKAGDLGAFALGIVGAEIDLGGVRLRALATLDRRVPFELTLHAARTGETLHLALEANADLFDPTTIERALERLSRLLAAAVENPEVPVSALPLLSAPERAELIDRFSRAAEPAPGVGVPVPAAVWARVQEAPEFPAIWEEGGSISYREMAARALALAGVLRARGVGPENFVAILAGRSASPVIGQLAVLWTGAAYLPLDPAHPDERLAYELADSGAVLLLASSEECLRARRLFSCPVLDLDSVGSPSSPLIQPVPVDSAHAAYAIYTSGSTGRPKAVVVSHGALANLVAWHLSAYRLTAADRTPLLAGPAFDAAVWETWPPLAAGAALLVPDEGLRTDPERLPDWLDRAGATVAFLSTPIAEACLAVGFPGLARLQPGAFRGEAAARTSEPKAPGWSLASPGGALPGNLRLLLTGGDRLRHAPPPGLPFVLVNHYGPTENAVVATAGEIPPGDGETPPSIGRPITGVRAFVLDRQFESNRELAPFGDAGELALGGAGLARGYHGRPDLTAERFVPDPFSGHAGARLYRTGDLVRFRADGALDFLGRIDAQVKIRGQRIELGEIEAALLAEPQVAAAAVVMFGAGVGARLAAYVVPAAAALDIDRLRARLRTKLPDAMVPSAFVEMPALPLTLNGKIDRRALPEPQFGSDAGEGFVPPQSPAEEILAAIFGEVLGLSEPIGRHDDLLALGLHSLTASRAAARVARALGREIPLAALFETPTVGALAEKLTEGSEVSETQPRPVAGPRGERAPLTFPQRRLWFLERLLPGRATYHVAGAVDLVGSRDEAALDGALALVVARHEALRTAIPDEEGEPLQVAIEWAFESCPRIDLAGLGEKDLETERLSRSLARRPFDIAAGPLVRFAEIVQGKTSARLVAIFHHLICDGAALDLFLCELFAAYAALAVGGTPNLPPVAIQLADVARWQLATVTLERTEEPLAYFRSRLADLEPLDLPSDRPRGARRSGRGRTVAVRFGAGLEQRIAARARSAGATPFMLWVAALQVLLSRISGRGKTAIGTPVANRRSPELERVFGFVANTLVLDAEMGDDPEAAVLIDRVRAGALAAYAREDLPFELLVEALAPRRDLAQNPLFDVLLSIEPALLKRQAGGLTLTPRRLDTGTAKLDLSLAVVPAEDGFEVWAEHDAELFDSATVARWLGGYERLLGALAAGAASRVSELPLLAPEELLQLLLWSGEEKSIAKGELLHARFFAQAERTPHALGVVAAEGTWTYGELAARALAIASALAARGVVPEERVGVLLHRGRELVASLLGVLAAGGAYVPLDPAYPEERLRFLLEDSGARICVAEKATAALVPDCVLLEDLLAGAVGGVCVTPDPRHLAYLIYTSGSTGRPKSVAIEHGTAAGFIEWALAAFSPPELLSVLFATSVCFDLSVFELFAPLSSGGALVLADNALDLVVAASRHPVTLINTVPSALGELVRGEGLPESVLTVNLAGEALPSALVERIFASSPNVRRVNNLYGPSEDTTYSTWVSIRREEAGAVPPIGRPLPGTQGYAVGRWGELLPSGVSGELRLGGAGLARGYLGRPELTAERFVPDPFSGVPGARLYATGDRVRWSAVDSGLPVLFYLGRIDNQVKVRGFRVELGEVESALAAAKNVREAAAAVVGEGADRRLVGFVAGEGVHAAEVLADLRGRLPGYLVPGTLTVLAALPRLPNGKLDRKELAKLSAGAEVSVGYVAPRNATEAALAELFAEVLGVERVGVFDDFFARGGHSLLAARAVARISRAFGGREVALSVLFEAPTVAGLGEKLSKEEEAASLPPILSVDRPADPETGLPLAFAQERLWFLEQLAPGATYNLAGAVGIEGRFDSSARERLAAALGLVVSRHEILRTAIRDGSAGPRQVVLPALPEVFLTLVDLEAISTVEESERVARSFGSLPFDLSRGQVLRALLVRSSADSHLLAVSLHHAAADGGSLGILIGEVAEIHAAWFEGRSPKLPPLPMQFADFSVWQRASLGGDALAPQLDAWRERLAGLPTLWLPTDRERPEVRTGRGAIRERRISSALLARLDVSARAAGASRFQALAATALGLLARLTGEARIPLGTPVANRPRVELEPLIGMFGNTLVLDVEVGDDPAASELLARTRSSAIAALALRELPFEHLVGELAPRRDTGQNPLFQVLFVLEEPLAPFAAGDLRLTPRRLDVGTARFDLTLEATPVGEALMIAAEYDTDLFEAATIDRWLGAYEHLLGWLADGSQRRLSELTLFSSEEESRLRGSWADRESQPPIALADREAGTASEEPRDEIEATLAVLFAEVLGRERVSVHDDFFALGGHSLLAARLAARIREVFAGGGGAASLPLARLFAAPSVAGLARELRASSALVDAFPLVRRPRDPEGEPLSFAEERMWFLERLEPGTAVYHLPFVLSLRGVGARSVANFAAPFAAALAEILRRHEPLRARFIEGETVVGTRFVSDFRRWEIPWTPDLLRLPKIDFTGLAECRTAEVRRIEGIEARRPFAIGREPLLRAAWLALEKETARLSVTLHHLASDGASLAVFSRELSALAAAFAQGRPSPLPELALGYADYAVWQRQELMRGALDAALAAAKTELADAPAGLDLPTDRPRKIGLASRGGEVPLVLSPELSARLAARARSAGATTFQLALGLLAALLSRLARVDDLVIGVPVAGRMHAEVEPLIGLFVNTVPVRLRLGGDPSFPKLLARARAATLAGLSRGEVPLERLIEELGANTGRSGRSDGRPPLFSVLFTYQSRTLDRPEVPGLAIEIEEIATGTAKLDLALSLRETDDGLAGRFEYDANLFDTTTIERWAAGYRKLLEAVADEPEISLSELARLLPEEPERAWATEVAVELAPAEERGYVSPRGPVEAAVAEIFSEVLAGAGVAGVEKIGAHDSFFALGGHSLLAARVLSQIRKRFGVALPLKSLFERPTVAQIAVDIAAEIEKRRAGAAPQSFPPLRTLFTLPPDTERPLSLAQERLWFLDRLGTGAAYNLPAAIKLSGPLRPAVLAAALSAVVRRHEGLRASFPERDGRPVLAIAAPGAVPLPGIDLSALGDVVRVGELSRLVRAEAALPFDLAAGPLLRALLVRLGPDEHVALFDHHHAVSDGWSIGLLLDEIGSAYAALSQGRAPALPPLPVQVADFAAWQRQRLAVGPELDRLLDFWRGALRDVPTVLDLPADRPRPAVFSTRGLAVPVALGAELSLRLEEFGRARGATTFAVLAAGFGALLCRWVEPTAQAPLLLGTPIAGRELPEVEPLIGFFANILPLVIDRIGEDGTEGSFAALLARVRARALDAFAHPELPFDRLVEDLVPRRDPSRPPLVQAALNWQAASPWRGARLGDLTLEPLEPLAGTGSSSGAEVAAKFELLLALERSPAGIAGQLEVSADLFERTTALRWADQLGRLLASAMADPDGAPWGDLAILSVEERQQTLVEWYAGQDPADSDTAPWHERVADWAGRAPDRPAAFFGDAVFTYGELVRRSRALALRLRALGLVPEDRVAMALDRSFEALIAIHGILSAGCAYVPLDAGYPAERIAFLLKDSGARAVVARREPRGRAEEPAWTFRLAQRWADRLAGAGLPLLLLGEEAEESAVSAVSGIADLTAVPFEPERMAYVIYTSGSTGVPKGVAISHRALGAYVAAETALLALGPDDCMPQFSSLGFDGSVEEIFAPLAAGGALALRGAELPGARELLRLFTERRVSVAFLPTAYWAQVAAAIIAEDLAVPATLREVRFGGEQGLGESMRELRRRAPAVRLTNVYGPTESTVIVAHWPLPSADALPALLPIGRAVPHGRLCLIDSSFRPVPRGAVGELAIGGPSLARGYLDRPSLTAERFVPDPFAAALGKAGARLYRTGDLARLAPDGNLEFLGRAEGAGGQVKLRGFRIELGEIEAALTRHPAVAAAAAAVIRSTRFADRLVAWVACPSSSCSAAELSAYLAEHVPAQLIPSAISVLTELPLNANGKVDRRALPPFAGEEEKARAAAYAPPAGGLEATLAAIWIELFGAAGPDDNFFDLGATSVSLVRLHSRIQAALGVEFPLVTLFQHPTLRSLAGSLGEAGSPAAAKREAAGMSSARDRSAERREGLAELERRRSRARRRV